MNVAAVLDPSLIPYSRRPDLVLGGADEEGFRVVKDPRSGEFYRLGPEESFLLEQLDGTSSPPSVCSRYEQRFGSPLTPDQLGEFIRLASSHGLLQAGTPAPPPPAPTPVPQPAPAPARDESPRPRPAQSLLRLRLKLFDPDRLFGWLCPRISFVWTWPFAALSTALILTALVIAGASFEELLSQLYGSLNVHTLVLVWTTLLGVTLLHEFAHGLTCKRYGGEVHEVGLLLIFLMPGMYCNVSDAWLFPQRWKRLLVTLAGGWSDLLFWSLAVLGWRVSQPGTFLNHALWVSLSVLGTRILFNLNPLIRLDGYYFLSDLAGIPNLQQRAMALVAGWARHLLWGGDRPQAQPRLGFLVVYGLASWCFGVGMLGMVLGSLMQALGDRYGTPGCVAVLALAFLLLRNLLSGFDDGEVERMFRTRPARILLWGGLAAGCLGYLAVGTHEDRSAGSFQLRSAWRHEARAPVSAFLREVYVREGEYVRAGAVLARLDVPNLRNRVEQNQAEIREAEARLRLLLAGARAEEREVQRRRAEHADKALARARDDLARSRQAHAAELQSLHAQLGAAQASAKQASAALRRARLMRQAGSLSVEGFEERVAGWETAAARVAGQLAQLRSRQVAGVRDAELEVLRREKELAEARSAVRLVEAKARAEEVEAEKAQLARVRRENAYLQQVESQLVVRSAQAGQVTTSRLEDKVGQYLHEGDLICAVEEPGELEAEVLLLDQEATRVQAGQRVELRPRDRPRVALHGAVKAVAPRSIKGGAEPSSTVTGVVVYCGVEDAQDGTRPGVLGHAWVERGRRPLRDILYEKALHLLRVEFWW